MPTDVGPDDARHLLEAWLGAVGVEERGMDLIASMQDDGFSHADLHRRARRAHEGRLRTAAEDAAAALGRGAPGEVPGPLFTALLPVMPYVSSAAVLGVERTKLVEASAPRKIAVVVDGIGLRHGVSGTIERIRERGVPGFEVDVIGTDAAVDHRLPAVAEIEAPFYPGLRLGVPALPDLVDVLTGSGYAAVHIVSPGPAGIAALLVARLAGLPVVASHHTELISYAAQRSAGEGVVAAARAALAAFYGAADAILSPSPAADRSLLSLGVRGERIGRWERGVDCERFSPDRAGPDEPPGEIRVLYSGRLTREKGIDLLAASFERARRVDPRLRLVLAGSGPEEGELRRRLGDGATFLGWLEGEDLPRAYADSDIFLFCSRTDTYGQVISEAGASGLPVIAVAEGGPAALVVNFHTGLLCTPDPDHIAGALLRLASDPELRRRLGAAGVRAARERTWGRSLGQLGDGYRAAVASSLAARQAGARAA